MQLSIPERRNDSRNETSAADTHTLLQDDEILQALQVIEDNEDEPINVPESSAQRGYTVSALSIDFALTDMEWKELQTRTMPMLYRELPMEDELRTTTPTSTSSSSRPVRRYTANFFFVNIWNESPSPKKRTDRDSCTSQKATFFFSSDNFVNV